MLIELLPSKLILRGRALPVLFWFYRTHRIEGDRLVIVCRYRRIEAPADSTLLIRVRPVTYTQDDFEEIAIEHP